MIPQMGFSGEAYLYTEASNPATSIINNNQLEE